MQRTSCRLSPVLHLAAGLVATQVWSITYLVPTDEALVEQSPVIVFATVEYTELAPVGYFTDASVRVEQVLKGRTDSLLVVRQQGGFADGRGSKVMGLPMLREGNRTLLFLVPGEDGVHRTVGMGLGIFFEDRGHLTRHDVPEDGFRNTERFSRWIADLEAGVKRQADYFADSIPGPQRNVQAYSLMSTACDSYASDYPRGTIGYLSIQSQTKGSRDAGVVFSLVRGTSDDVSAEWDQDTRTVTYTTARDATWSSAARQWNVKGYEYPAGAPELGLTGVVTPSGDRHRPVQSGSVTLAGGDLDPSYVRWPQWDSDYTRQSGEPDLGIRARIVDWSEDDRDWSDGVAEVNAASGIWNAVAGSTVVLPAVNPDLGEVSLRSFIKARIDVSLGEQAVVAGKGNILAKANVRYMCADTLDSTRIARMDHVVIDVSKSEHAKTQAGLRHLLLHELGHGLGLDHSADSAAVMAPGLDKDNLGFLHADDESAIRFLYAPGFGRPPSGGGDPDDDDPLDKSSRASVVAPYWTGPSGGFTVMPAKGRNSVTVTCGSRSREYEAENGVVTRLVRGDCGKNGLRIEGAAAGGWYWQHGDRNAAVAPLVHEDDLASAAPASSSDLLKAVVPGGVMAEATDTATWFRHDASKLVGIVPHLADNECSEYVTPYWHGRGGIVARPEEGRESVSVKVKCGRTHSTQSLIAGDDGVAVGLIERSYCIGGEGNPKEGRLTVKGAGPGGWYWIKGERNAAVGPLMCPALLGGPKAVDPGGVLSWTTEDGTFFQHDAEELIGVVPHIKSDN